MEFKLSHIEKRVYDLLDENGELLGERMEYCDPGADLGQLIRDLVPQAARVVLLQSAASKIDECRHITSAPLRREGQGCMVMPLPPGFMRLLYIKMSDWQRGVTVPLPYNGEAYQVRTMPRFGRRQQRGPAVAVRERGDLRELEIFGSDSGANLETLDYIAEPSTDGATIDLPLSLLGDICRKTALMVREIIGDDR